MRCHCDVWRKTAEQPTADLYRVCILNDFCFLVHTYFRYVKKTCLHNELDWVGKLDAAKYMFATILRLRIVLVKARKEVSIVFSEFHLISHTYLSTDLTTCCRYYITDCYDNCTRPVSRTRRVAFLRCIRFEQRSFYSILKYRESRFVTIINKRAITQFFKDCIMLNSLVPTSSGSVYGYAFMYYVVVLM